MSLGSNESRAQLPLHGGGEKPAILTNSSNSDDGNGSSGDSDEADTKPTYELTADDGRKTSYRDFSRVPPDKKNSTASLLAPKKEPTFPVKLHMILSNPEFADIIAWLPHGRSWRIIQQNRFEEVVIPQYYRHGRYSSFARQVNGWGFRRITHGSDYNSYYHELFLRGLPHLCDKMRRLTAKDIGKRKKEDDQPAPDFYQLSRDNPLPEKCTAVPHGTTMASVTPPAIAAAAAASRSQAVAGNNIGSLAHVELAILEKRRSDILHRINMVSRQGEQPNGTSSSEPVPTGQQQSLLAFLQSQSASAPSPSTLLQTLGGLGHCTDLASILASLNQGQSSQTNFASTSQGSISAPPPSPIAPPIPTVGLAEHAFNTLLQQALVAIILQQGGSGMQSQQASVINLLAQLLIQTMGAPAPSQAAAAPSQAAPAPTQAAPAPSALAQPLSSTRGPQSQSAPVPSSSFAQTQPAPVPSSTAAFQSTAPAPTANPSNASQQQPLLNNSTIAQLLSSGSNDASSNLQRQLLEASLRGGDLASLLSLARQNHQDGGQ